MDSRISLASGCDALYTTAREAQCNVQMLPTTMKQETVQCCDVIETNCDNHVCGYNSLKPSNSFNYYDGQFSVSTEVKEEFPEDECPQSSTAASCINKSAIDSNTVIENEELPKVLEAQEVSEEAFSFVKIEEVHDNKDKFIATTEISTSKVYQILGNSRDTRVLDKVPTIPQEIQPKMCGGILKNRFNSLTHNNEHIKIEPPTLVGDEGMELHKCQYCDDYFHYDNMLAHVDDVHSHKKHKSELYRKSTKKIHAERNVDEINYECDSCNTQFPTQIHLRQHKNQQHSANVKSTNNVATKTEFQCDICKNFFKSNGGLKRHILSIHYDYDKTFNCWCGKQFRTPTYLYQHKNRQHGANAKSINNAALKTEFQCDICKIFFKSKGSLKIHILGIHYDYRKTFKCWCGKQFRTPNHLYRHKNNQHDPNSKSKNNAAFKKEFECDICKKIFKRKYILKRHMTSIHYDYGKTFSCWCGKQFRVPRQLYQHTNRQHGANVKSANNTAIKKEFLCNVCKKTFKRKGGLKTHILDIHYNYSKTFNCWCGKQFRTPNHLYRHKNKQHDANSKSRNNAAFEKEFQCDICKKTFKKKKFLKIHITSIHYDYGKTFNCWCGKKFRTPKHLYQHKYNQHDTNSKRRNNAAFENEFQCDICKKTFKRKYILKRHITSIHYDYGKTFNCWCGKQFRSPKHLYQHKYYQHDANRKRRNNATFEKEFQCDICKKIFKRKYILKRHITSIHYDCGKTFNCWCGKQFRASKYLHKHKNHQHSVYAKSTNNVT